MDVQADRFTAPSQPGHTGRWLVIALVAGTIVYVGLLLAGGEARDLALAGLETIPFVILALLAYAGIRRRWARVLALIWLVLLTVGGVFAAVGFVWEAEGTSGEIGAVTAGCLTALLLGWLCYLPAVRRAVSGFIPLDPDSFVHGIALVLVVSLTLMFFVPLLVLGDPPMLLNVQQEGSEDYDTDLLSSLYGLFWLVPSAIVAVGYPLARGWREALVRVGLLRPSTGQIIFGFAMGAAMVAVFLGVDRLIHAVWTALDLPVTDVESFEEIMAHAINPIGAVVVGVTAGLGEELAVRGVLQPRLGILLSNLFFTALHAFQYNFDALLSVFLLGLVFGLIRRRTNTTTSAIVHGFYDFVLVLFAAMNVPGF